jgi:hypothetical protein
MSPELNTASFADIVDHSTPQDQIDTTRSFRSCEAIAPEELSDVSSSVEGAALCAFFARFITCSRRPETVTGYLEELPCIYLKASKRYPILHSILNALSLALYGISQKSERIVARGRQVYYACLRMLSELVSDSHDKISVDELTLSVLLSGFYEVGNSYTAREELLSIERERESDELDQALHSALDPLADGYPCLYSTLCASTNNDLSAMLTRWAL